MVLPFVGFDIDDGQVEVKQDRLDRHLEDHTPVYFRGSLFYPRDAAFDHFTATAQDGIWRSPAQSFHNPIIRRSRHLSSRQTARTFVQRRMRNSFRSCAGRYNVSVWSSSFFYPSQNRARLFSSVSGHCNFSRRIGDRLRDSDPSSLPFTPSRRGSRSCFRAEHVNKPMPRDCVGCHNRRTRRGHDHDDDGSSRNRQIVDDPA